MECNMKKTIFRVFLAALPILLLSAGSAQADNLALRQQANAMIGVLPDKMPGSGGDSPALIALGKTLYMEKRLSKNDSQSCNSCHNVEAGGSGVDNAVTSTGAFGEKGGRNAPTVWNAGFQVAQFWDGRAADLVAQAKGPVLNPVEMAMPDEKTVEQKLQAIPSYRKEFAAAIGKENAITYNNMAMAIAAFERTLITRDRLDEYLKGNDKALSVQEIKGLKAFMDTGCTACHNGPTLGGKSFQKLGLANAYRNSADQGRHAVTGNESDRMVFKVPMLRDIGRTAPYFHDGSIATLEEAVAQMAWLQLGKKLEPVTISDITAFLRALNHQG
jgi:cytochrome c peroxidase